MLTKKEEALFFSFRQHLFYATEAKISLVLWDSVSKSVYAYPFYSFLQNYLFLIK